MKPKVSESESALEARQVCLEEEGSKFNAQGQELKEPMGVEQNEHVVSVEPAVSFPKMFKLRVWFPKNWKQQNPQGVAWT